MTDHIRKVDAKHSAWIAWVIAEGAIPTPETSFTTTLGTELRFYTQADAEAFDLLTYMACINSN